MTFPASAWRAAVVLFMSAATLAPGLAPARSQPAAVEPAVAEVANLAFHSGLPMNLHHTLFAAAWARRPEAGTLRALAGALPAPLDGSLGPAERAVWDCGHTRPDSSIARGAGIASRSKRTGHRTFAA
jgi:hypothetical protein